MIENTYGTTNRTHLSIFCCLLLAFTTISFLRSMNLTDENRSVGCGNTIRQLHLNNKYLNYDSEPSDREATSPET